DARTFHALLFCLSLILLPPSSTLFPYTTLFRSLRALALQRMQGRQPLRGRPQRGRAAVVGQTIPRRESQHLELRREIGGGARGRSEEHTSELQSRGQLVCRLLLEKKNAQPDTTV